MTALTAHAAAPARRRLLARLLSVPVTAAAVVAGVWLAGGAITNDFTLAMWLTAAWMAVAGLGAVAIGVRSRTFRRPVLGTYVLTAGALAVVVGTSTLADDVVNERVARAAGGNALVAAGGFEPVRHAVRGEARVIELAAGGRVLTLTAFEVDNGPDLRVYLVAGPARGEDDVDDVVDLGALKGNRGNQQYSLSTDVDLERYSTVVIWCRAFSALFARASLGERS